MPSGYCDVSAKTGSELLSNEWLSKNAPSANALIKSPLAAEKWLFAPRIFTRA